VGLFALGRHFRRSEIAAVLRIHQLIPSSIFQKRCCKYVKLADFAGGDCQDGCDQRRRTDPGITGHGDIEANYSTPTESPAGDSKYVSGSYGFGDLQTNGYNVLAAFRHDQQSQIKSTGREFAKTAYIPFDFRGNHYIYDRTSTATIPANVTATFNNSIPSIGFSPYLKKNGNCPDMTTSA
jgi:hypothetical protein